MDTLDDISTYIYTIDDMLVTLAVRPHNVVTAVLLQISMSLSTLDDVVRAVLLQISVSLFHVR